jgi:PAS domain S-box-containing protein
MAHEQNYSYLDLSVHDDLAGHVLSPDPVVLFNTQLNSIIWANAPGAQLFSGKGIIDLLDVNLSDSQTFVRQLRDAVEQMDGKTHLVRGFRINLGLRSVLLQFEIMKLKFNDGNVCYKVVQRSSGDVSVDENTSANTVVESLEGFADGAAIVDDYGLPIAATKNFGNLGPDEVSMAELITELKDEDDRLIKRQIKSARGQLTIAGLGRFSENPGRSLIVLAKAEEEASQDTATLNLLDGTDTPSTRTSISDENPDELEPVSELDEPAPILENDNAQETDQVSELIAPSFTPPLNEEDHQIEGTTLESEEFEPSSSEIADDEADQDENGDHNDEAPEDTSQPVSDAPLIDKPKERLVDLDLVRTPIEVDTTSSAIETAEDHQRFAWTTNELSEFTSISPELADAVGKTAADVIGKEWKSVAARLRFDLDGEIERALAKKDTWSGKTVLWPVEGTDMVIPVDLAALPSFGSERQFNGFRGFGIIRSLDAIVDPEETGIALLGQPSGSLLFDDIETVSDVDTSTSEEHIVSSLWFETNDDIEDETDTRSEDLDITDDKEQSLSSNVVQLVPRANTTQSEALSDKENKAFETIGEQLRDETGLEEDKEPETTSDSKRTPDTSLIENLPVAVLIYRDGAPLFANQRLLEAAGYSSSDEILKLSKIEDVLETIETDDGEVTHILHHKSGDVIEINPVLHTVRWDEEKALQLSFTPPVTPSIIMPDALEMTQASEIQSILDATNDGIILLQDDGEVISINAPAEALFNRDFDDVTGKHITTLFADESHGDINQYVNGVVSPVGEVFLHEGREVIAEAADGGLLPVLLTIAKLESSGKLCAVIRDLSVWKKTEEELLKTKREAEKASEQKSGFLAHVSHEIRIPLTAIIGFSDIMIEERFGPVNNERYRDYLRDIKRSGSHVLDLINDLLDLSKIEAGKLELNFEAIDLNNVVSESVAILQPTANEDRIIIRTSLSRSVPKVVADLRSVRQIILNLVTNAIKFSPSNSQVIVSTVYESNGEVALRVRDTGSGMTEDQIEEAMKPFSQVHDVDERTKKGTGLGLPLTRALVEANRAYFDLESEPGTGTIAHVQFPIQRVLAD